LSVAGGIALGHLLKNTNKHTLVFTGEGGTSEGDFHEALNVAAVWNLPVIFVIENNGYGLSTPVSEQFKCEQLADRGKGYGMIAKTIDGNNVLEVFKTIKWARKTIEENPQPILIEAMTFRMRGHEEASGTKYVPQELMDYWAERDPVELFEQFLKDENIIDQQLVDEQKALITKEIQDNLDIAFAENEVEAEEKEKHEIYAPYEQNIQLPSANANKKEQRFIDAISDGLDIAMQQHDNLLIMGQDVAEYGGVFKITDGFVEKYGRERVRNTPLCESAILGCGLGLSINNHKSVVEMQFSDFVTCGFNQIVNNLAKLHYRWGQNVDVVVRMPSGGGVAAGPFHSQTIEAWFFHVPGLKIVYPSTPEDAKGLLIAAIEDPNPVMYFEHKAMYRKINGEVAEGYFNTPIGKARQVREGQEVSIITYGMGVHWATELIEKHPNIDADIVDLRTLLPLDKESIIESVKRTGKVLILHEATMTGGVGAELSAIISENCFEYLDAPVVRSASLDTPVPFAPNLEAQFLPVERFEKQLLDLVAY